MRLEALLSVAESIYSESDALPSISSWYNRLLSPPVLSISSLDTVEIQCGPLPFSSTSAKLDLKARRLPFLCLW